jgi:integrase
MDTPADPATPLQEVYQAFFTDLEMEGTKKTTIDRYRYNILRFEKWLIDNEHPAILASLERTILFGYRKYLGALPQQPLGSTRRRRGGLMSRHTVHSYLRSIKCLASWLKGAGHLDANPFLAVNLLQEETRHARPSGRRSDPEGRQAVRRRDPARRLRGRPARGPRRPCDGLAALLVRRPADDAAQLTMSAIDFEARVLLIEDGKGDKDRQAFISARAAEHVRAYIDRGRIPLVERMPRRHGPVPAGGAFEGSNLAEAGRAIRGAVRRDGACSKPGSPAERVRGHDARLTGRSC